MKDRLKEIYDYLKFKKLIKTQSDLASMMGYNRVSVSKAINGHEGYMTDEFISKLVETFPEVDKSWLLTGEGEMLKEQDQQGENEAYLVTKCGTKYYELPFGKFKMRVSLVPIEAYAKYIDEYRDADHISGYSEIDFIVDKIRHGRYLAFEIKGDSMDDDSKRSIPDGSIVLARDLAMDYWRDGLRFKDYPYWIIVLDNTILCKEIISHDVERNIITCHSLNDAPEYEDFDINLKDVKQLLNIVGKQFF